MSFHQTGKGKIVKVEVKGVVLSVDPGFVIEGEDAQHIEEAVLRFFYFALPTMNVRPVGIVSTPPSANAPSIMDAEDMLNDAVDMEDMDRVIEENEAFLRRQGNLFANEAA